MPFSVVIIIFIISNTTIKDMGANLSQNDQHILDADYCGVHGVDNEIEKHDVMRNPDAI